jgi:hypothetical protein
MKTVPIILEYKHLGYTEMKAQQYRFLAAYIDESHYRTDPPTTEAPWVVGTTGNEGINIWEPPRKEWDV